MTQHHLFLLSVHFLCTSYFLCTSAEGSEQEPWPFCRWVQRCLEALSWISGPQLPTSWLPWQRTPTQTVPSLRNFLPGHVLTLIAIKKEEQGVKKRCIIAFTVCFSSCVKKQIQWEVFQSVFCDTENNFLFILLTFLFNFTLGPVFSIDTPLFFFK